MVLCIVVPRETILPVGGSVANGRPCRSPPLCSPVRGAAARAAFGAAAVPSASAARPPSPAARQGRAVGGSVATSPGA